MVQAANVNVGLNLESSAFVSGAQQARQAMVSNLDAIQKESAKTAAALSAVPDSLKRFSSANDNLKRFGNVAQQAGYQIGDFAVQVSSGGSALTAFIQQGTQVAGAFGPVGAVIGAAGAVVGVFARSMLDAGTSVDDAQTQLKKLTEGTKSYQQALIDIEPLQRAFLQNIVDSTKEETLSWYERLLGLVGSLNTTFADLKETQKTGVGIGTREGIQDLIRSREREYQGIDEYLNRNKPGIIAKAERKPGLEEREYYKEQIEAEKKLATERKAAAEKAATAAKILADQKAKLIAQINEEVEASKRLTEVVGKGAYAQELANIENKKQHDLIEKTKGLVGEELELQKKKIEGLAKEARIRASIETALPSGTSPTHRQAERESFEEYGKAAPDIEATRLRAEQKAAKKLEDIYAQPFKDLATNLAETLSGGIQDAISGDFDFGTFADGFAEIFSDTLAASITAALTPALTGAAESFGDVLMKALGGAAGGGAPGGAPGAAGGLTMGGAALGGALAGGIAGGLYGSYAPGMKPGNYAGVGGAIGGGLGAVAGQMLIPIPGVGAVIGAGVGTALGAGIGGLFGGQNNLGNDRSAQAYRSSRGLTYSDASFSQENRAVTQGIIDQLTVLQEALETAGGAIANFGLRIEAGNKSGITVNGKKYPDAQAALAASLEVLIGGTTGLTASQQTVLQTTKAKDAQGIVADLGVAEQFDQLTFKGTELARQLMALDAEMEAFGKRAQALGLDINAVAAAHEEQRQALIDAQAAEQNQIRAAIDALAPSGNALELQLALLNDQVQALAAAATNAGLPIDDLAAAHQRAADQLVSANQQLLASLALQVSALDPAIDQVSLALAQLNAQVQSLASQILASGGSIDELGAVHQRAAAKIIADAQAAQQAQAEAAAEQRRAAVEQQRAAELQRRGVWEQLAAAGGDKSLKTQMYALTTQMRQLGNAAADAGIPIAEVTKAHIRAAAELTRVFTQQVRGVWEQLAQAGGDRSLKTQLYILQTQMEDLAKAAKDAGIPLSEVTKAHTRAAAEVHRLFEQQVRGVWAQLAAVGGDRSLETQLYVLTTQMRDLAKATADAGIPLSEITKAHTRAAAEISRAFEQQVRGVWEQIAAARGDTSLATQLYVLDTQMRELEKAAKDAGIAVSVVTAAHAVARDNLRKDFENTKQGVLDQIISVGGGNELVNQLRSLDRQMYDLAKAATAVGIPLSQVNEAHSKAEEILRQEFEQRKRALRAQVDELGQFGAPLDRSLGQLQSKVEDLERELIAAGLPIDRLAEAHRRAAEQIREDWEESLRDMRRQQRDATQGILDAQRGAAGAIDQFLDPFKEALSSRGIGQGVYSGAALSQSGLKEFRSALAGARTGDTGAISTLVGIGQGAISQARQTYGSTEAFARIFEEIQRGLQEQQGVLEQKRDQLLEQIGTFGRETVDEIIRLRVQAIGDLRQDLAKLSRDLIVAVEGRS